MRTNFPNLIRNYDFMIQISMSVKLPYKKIIQRSPGNGAATSRLKV